MLDSDFCFIVILSSDVSIEKPAYNICENEIFVHWMVCLQIIIIVDMYTDL